jgi:sec-independent protein translocase protein TatB
MFDVGFSEMLVIGIVALVVIGPERLPRVARTLGVLFGRMQRYVTQVKADINREMEAADLGKVKSEFESAARGFKSDIEAQAADAEREIREAQASIDRELQGAKEAVAPGGGSIPAPEPSPQLELGIEEPAREPAAPPPAPGKPA